MAPGREHAARKQRNCTENISHMLNPDFAQPGLAITSQTKSYRVTPYELRGYELNVKMSTLGVDHMGRY